MPLRDRQALFGKMLVEIVGPVGAEAKPQRFFIRLGHRTSARDVIVHRVSCHQTASVLRSQDLLETCERPLGRELAQSRLRPLPHRAGFIRMIEEKADVLLHRLSDRRPRRTAPQRHGAPRIDGTGTIGRHTRQSARHRLHHRVRHTLRNPMASRTGRWRRDSLDAADSGPGSARSSYLRRQLGVAPGRALAHRRRAAISNADHSRAPVAR